MTDEKDLVNEQHIPNLVNIARVLVHHYDNGIDFDDLVRSIRDAAVLALNDDASVAAS